MWFSSQLLHFRIAWEQIWPWILQILQLCWLVLCSSAQIWPTDWAKQALVEWSNLWQFKHCFLKRRFWHFSAISHPQQLTRMHLKLSIHLCMFRAYTNRPPRPSSQASFSGWVPTKLPPPTQLTRSGPSPKTLRARGARRRQPPGPLAKPTLINCASSCQSRHLSLPISRHGLAPNLKRD